MADIIYRANLSAVSIPLISEEFGRTVIVKQQDQNFVPTVVSKADQDKDIGIPQVYYAHNVMPTNFGYKSVGFSLQIPAAVPAVNTFHQVFPFFGVAGEKAYLAINTDGTLYTCCLASSYTWVPLANTFSKAVVAAGANVGSGFIHSLQVLGGSAAKTYSIAFTSATAFTVTIGAVANTTGTLNTLCTTADGKTSFIIIDGDISFAAGDNFSITLSAASFTGAATQAAVAGNTYLCIAGIGLFSYDYVANTLYTVDPAGIDCTNIIGICSAAGYLVTYSADAVAWSSLIDSLDFVPSLITGSGGGSVEGAKGPIRRCVGLGGGFVVFTAQNGVSAQTSGNARYPFVFKEISNCGGLSDLTLCTEESDSSSIYAFTTFGLQQVSSQKASIISPEITDFLAGHRMEDFNTETLAFTRSNIASPFKKRIEYVSGRYLVMSYGLDEFTHAVIYDTALQRYGKIKLVHRSVFQYAFLDADAADTPKRQLAFLTTDGAVTILDFSTAAYSPDSVMLLGKFQYVRTRLLQLQGVSIETIDPESEFSLLDLPSMDGKTLLPAIEGYQVTNSAGLRAYKFHNTALNHTLALRGNFRSNTVELNFNVHGAR